MLPGAGTQVPGGDFYLKNATLLVLPLGASSSQGRYNCLPFFGANRHGPSPEFSQCSGSRGLKR